MEGIEYHLTIPGRPVPKGRPRMSKYGHAYTPKTTREYEDKIKWYCSELVDKPIDSLVNVVMRFYIAGKAKPDIDNLIKSVLDGLHPNLIANDNLVQKVNATRVSVPYKEDQRVEVTIWEAV